MPESTVRYSMMTLLYQSEFSKDSYILRISIWNDVFAQSADSGKNGSISLTTPLTCFSISHGVSLATLKIVENLTIEYGDESSSEQRIELNSFLSIGSLLYFHSCLLHSL